MEPLALPGSDWAGERVLVLAAGRDSSLTCEVVTANGIRCEACPSVEQLALELEAGLGAVILAEEVLTETTVEQLAQLLQHQPPWSDLPLIVVASGLGRVGRALRPLDLLGNVSVLPRPLSIDTLVSTLQSALRARRRQYQVRDLLRERDRADKRKDEFMAMLAHELRNPLAPLRYAAEILKQRLDPDSPLNQVQAIIERQVEHQAHLLDDLLDVSRITRGKITLHPVRLDLVRLIREAGEDCRSVLEEAGLSLSLLLPPESVWIDGDPTRLAQVITNLLVNAVKFTDRGGEVRVELVTEPVGQLAVVSVQDTGIGIEPDRVMEIFEPFMQADRSLDRSRGGLGLGLALVKGLVELHQGSVWAYSEGLGRGTEIRFLLPLAAPPAEAAIPAPAPAVRHPTRVLIIDDNRDAAETLQQLLELSGYEVSVALTGPEGLEKARAVLPQVVLCDLGLPGMDGFQVAAALRHDPATASTRLVAISGYAQDGDRHRACEAGFDDHLVKPVAFEELVDILSQASERSRA